jgi:YVTN family beta-propeller protein
MTGSVDDPRSVGVSPDGRKVYVTNTGTSTVSVFDAATRTEVAVIPVGGWPINIAMTPDGQKAHRLRQR